MEVGQPGRFIPFHIYINIKDERLDTLCSLWHNKKVSIEFFNTRVRNREVISVDKCKNSGIIFLNNSPHHDFYYYSKKTIDS